MLLSRLFIGRLSPRNLQRFSSFDTPIVRAASLGFSKVGGTAQANLHRNTAHTSTPRLLHRGKEGRDVTKFTWVLRVAVVISHTLKWPVEQWYTCSTWEGNGCERK